MSARMKASLTAPRIALFMANLDGGGAERNVLNLAEGFGERGWSVDLLMIHAAGPYLDLPQTGSGGIRFVELRPRHRSGKKGMAKWWECVLCTLPLARYLEQTPCVLISTIDIADFLALVFKRFRRHDFGLIVRNQIHLSAYAQLGWRTRLLMTMIRRLLPVADAIVANSQGTAEDIRWHVPKVAPRVVVIHNAVVAPALVEQAAEPVAHPWFEGSPPPVILAVGRLVPQKDYPTLFKAFATVVHSRPAVRLVVLGEGPLRRDLEALATRLGVAASVDLPGFQLNPFAWMAKAQVLALSSRAEGSPNVLVQAMACGTPVVSTDCPSGPREILADGALGPLVPVGDSPALAQAILKTLDNPPPSERLIARANEYSVESSVNQYLGLVTQLTGRQPPNVGHASRNKAP